MGGWVGAMAYRSSDLILRGARRLLLAYNEALRVHLVKDLLGFGGVSHGDVKVIPVLFDFLHTEVSSSVPQLYAVAICCRPLTRVGGGGIAGLACIIICFSKNPSFHYETFYPETFRLPSCSALAQARISRSHQ